MVFQLMLSLHMLKQHLADENRKKKDKKMLARNDWFSKGRGALVYADNGKQL